MIVVTLTYDVEKKMGAWGVVSGDQTRVSLLDVAEAFAWAEWDAIMKLAKAQIGMIKEEEKDEGV